MMSYQIIKEILKKHGHEQVIFVGIDIGKYQHVVSIWNGYKDILLKPYEFSSQETGYQQFRSKLDETISKVGPAQMFIGCEPSGHYYLNLMQKLKDDYPEAHFRLINPKATKSQRDMAMERHKTDSTDTTAILELLLQGHTYQMPFNEQIFQEIKEVVRRVDNYTKHKAMLKNQIHTYLDELYPNFEKKGTSLIETLSGSQFLSILPDPQQLKAMDEQDILNLFQIHGYTLRKAYAKKFAQRAQQMLLPDKPLIKSKLHTLQEYIENYLLIDGYLKKATIILETLLADLQFTENLMELKGMGPITLSRIIAYLNNPFRFQNGSQAAQFAGLTPAKSQSGTSEKKEAISRLGHKKLRSVMVQLTHQLINSTGYFTAFYNRLVLENGKDINLAVTATAHKALRVIIKMIHSGEKFDPPTAQSNLANAKIKRLTKKRLTDYRKNKKARTGTQNMLDTYLTRV